jgi:hypothetical protein
LKDLNEESFHLELYKTTSISRKGKNNPITNGKMNKIISELVDEALREKEYKAKNSKFYADRLAQSNAISKNIYK